MSRSERQWYRSLYPKGPAQESKGRERACAEDGSAAKRREERSHCSAGRQDSSEDKATTLKYLQGSR